MSSDRINTGLFIARRLSAGGGQKPNVMVRIATVTVAVSTAVMLISLAVISGFRSEISDKLIGFGGHVQIVNLDGNTSFETVPIYRDPALEVSLKQADGLTSVYPYAVKGGIVKTDEAMQGIMLKGVDGDYDWTFFSDNLVEGSLPVVGDSIRTKDILVSRKLASLMRFGVDDRVEMLFVQDGRQPRRDRFTVTGIYDSGLEELDMIVVPTDIRNVQRLSGWDNDMITGYEVNTADFRDIDRFTGKVYDAVVNAEEATLAYLMIVDIRQRYPALFDWLAAFDVNAAVIIVIMILVAFLNMMAALLILLLERTAMIGTLKALGMDNSSLQRIFVIRSASLVAKGMLWGNAVGIGICMLQKYTGFIKLNEAGYFLSAVPVRMDWQWLLGLNAGVFALLVLLLVLPTRVVSRIKPDVTMRYQ